MCTDSDDGSLVTIAKDAVAQYPDSDVDIAFTFSQATAPAFPSMASNDRLVKVGRLVASLVRDYADDPSTMVAGLRLVVQECELLSRRGVLLRVPTVPFGKTGLAMPIVTLGCMRFQQNWGTRIKTMNEIDADCQDNLVAILRQAFAYGMTHIETARGYGTSELQLGAALRHLMALKEIQRQDFILQTKVPAQADPAQFRTALETSFKNLQVDHVDLFAFHGMNYEEQYDWVFGEGKGGNCMDVIKEYVAAGKIRHVGFSTHGATDFILRLINTDAFDYVNLHYHYFGSYTASGGGHDGNGNLDCVKLLAAKNMGCFIISPFDKGGALYEPSKKLRSLTLPDMEPMMFKSWWIWNHHRLCDGHPQCHTYTVGAARPSDLDQPAVAAYLQARNADEALRKTTGVVARLEIAKEAALGAEWVKTWWKGLPKSRDSLHQIEHNQVVWLYNLMKSFGMRTFARNRYSAFESNEAKWDESLSPKDNISKKVGKGGWGFVPGRSLKPDTDYTDDLAKVPASNLDKVKEAEAFVYKVLHRGSDASAPDDWTSSYTMRVWRDFPDRSPRLD